MIEIKIPDKETDVTMDDRVLVDTHRVRQWCFQLLNEYVGDDTSKPQVRKTEVTDIKRTRLEELFQPSGRSHVLFDHLQLYFTSLATLLPFSKKHIFSFLHVFKDLHATVLISNVLIRL